MTPFNKKLTVTALAALTDLMTIPVNGLLREATITIDNTNGTNATNGLAIFRQHDDGGPWIPWLSGTDFNTATSAYSPSNNPPPNAVPVGQIGFVDIKPGAVNAIKIQLSSAVGTTVVLSLAGRDNEH